MENDLVATKEIAKLFNIIGFTNKVDGFYLKDIEMLGVKYTIVKQGDTIVIDSSDGRHLRVSSKFIYTPVDGYYSSYSVDTTDIEFEFGLVNNTSVLFKGSILERTDYEVLQELTPEQLKETTKPTLITPHRRTKFGWNGIPENAKIDDNGITIGAFTVDRSGTEIKEINGESIPSYKSIQSFNLQQEQAKILKFMNDPKVNLNDITKKVLENTLVYLEQKSKYLTKGSSDYYYVLSRANDFIDDRFTFLNGLHHGIYTSQELNMIIKDVEKYLSQIQELTQRSFSK